MYFPICRFFLVGRFKFAQEADVVLREHAEVADAIFQVGDALHTHAKGIAAVGLAVDAALFEDVGIHHAAAQNLYPSGVLAEATAFATADEAGDVHLCRWFCEREVAGTQTNLRVGSEHLSGKAEEHLLQVGEGNVLFSWPSSVCSCSMTRA